MRLPLGDHAGEMIGSLDTSIACSFAPSASATCSSKRAPRFTT